MKSSAAMLFLICPESLMIYRNLLDSINWASPGDTFQRFTKLLAFPFYSYNVLLGLTVSVGGLTESVVRPD